MKTIVDDPEGFFDNGGWTFLNPESDVCNLPFLLCSFCHDNEFTICVLLRISH